jgi:energy-coupling factor transporter ATP-binding protein EcfA2
MRAEDDHRVQPAGVIAHGLPVFIDRESEARRLDEAVRKRESLVICGPAGMGKTALVSTVLRRLPPDLAARCLYFPGARDLQDLLHQLVRKLYDRKDPNLRHQLHAEGISVLTFETWLKEQSSSHLKGTLYRTVEQGDYRVFLDHLPPLTNAVAKVIKELFWMRNTPVYLLIRDEVEQHLPQLYDFFYWGDRERLALQPLPAHAAAELLESCIERFGLSRLDLREFRKEALALSKRVPGAIVRMCTLAAEPRYQYGLRIKVKSLYIEYLMSGHALFVYAPPKGGE